jgi:hypothetical protein
LEPTKRAHFIEDTGEQMTASQGTDLFPEDVEGIEQQPEGTSRDYPLDDVMVRTETRSAREVVERIAKGRYILDPEFQRDFVWDVEKQSRLIESCVMRIPLPVFYVAEAPDGRIIVVDGLQRLTTFQRFLEGKLRLSGLAKNADGSPHSLEGRVFSELDTRLQERIEDTQLVLYILDRKAPEAARLDIFERVNSGAPLTRQQMRNALYSGDATRWLKAQAESVEFVRVNAGSLKAKTMRDREAINRFCAFYLLGPDAYPSGEMDDFLAAALTKMNNMVPPELDDMASRFRHSMSANYRMFKHHAFRKSLAEVDETAPRTPLNISMFDVFSVSIAKIDPFDCDLYEPEIKSALLELMRDDTFRFSVTYSTNSGPQVSTRFEEVDGRLSRYYS